MRRSILFLAWLIALPLAAEVSDRSTEVLRYGCANELGHREVTLFRNGTVRLLDGPPGQEWMGMAELNPDDLAAALNRLRDEDLSEAHHYPKGVEGPYIERCELWLQLPEQLPDQKPDVFRFSHYDALPLNLSRVVQVALDLEKKVEDLKGVEELPPDYEPRLYDVLKRRDGQRYRILRFTPGNKGVELQGIDQPLVLFVLKEEMRKEFVALLSRRK